MKAFITGSTGFVGSRVLDQLLAQRFEISALVRREEDAEALKRKGVQPVLGDLTSLDTIAAAAQQADVTLHLAFIHNFAAYDQSIKVDIAVTERILTVLAGTNKKFIVTSGTAMGGDSGNGLLAEGEPGQHSRGLCEVAALKGVEQGVQVFVMRLPIYVYDESEFVSFMVNLHVQAAKKHQAVSYVGSGSQKFSVGHVNDVAAAYVAAAKYGNKSGIYNIVGEHGITALQLATAISKKLSKGDQQLPTRSVTVEEAQSVFNNLAFIFAMNNDSDNTKAQTDFKWQPHKTSGFLDVVASSA